MFVLKQNAVLFDKQKALEASEVVPETGNVLDVGGGMCPLAKATHVLDLESFDNFLSTEEKFITGTTERRFSIDTWIQMDICSGKWPFPDNYFDFVWCSHTLEDIRDPVHVCKEMSRVGKKGFVICPSIGREIVHDMDYKDDANLYNGYRNHRWFVTKEEDKLLFIFKDGYSTVYKYVNEEYKEKLKNNLNMGVISVFWEDKIEGEELFIQPDNTFKIIKKQIEGQK
ncbi:methyltransferase domain-containing protein [Oceanihabitans sediminis]|uniref:class I SAM-dependent methyltransferase n=1 Tax=Oceanihabitans sediminis TaxID=1812012 RepID=UPI00299E719C|nr:methyltransferase domain-containing protein [Oceanihabitans sediminis]MDX1279339.1 methyltransferase domain-containing protein [Oceanihabitans sediminis]